MAARAQRLAPRAPGVGQARAPGAHRRDHAPAAPPAPGPTPRPAAASTAGPAGSGGTCARRARRARRRARRAGRRATSNGSARRHGRSPRRVACQQVDRQRDQHQHAVDAHQQAEAERGPGQGAPGGVAALFPQRHRQQREEEEELGEALRHRVAREPDLYLVDAPAAARPAARGRRRSSRRSAKYTASVARMPNTGGVASAPFTPMAWNRYAPKAGNRWKNSGTTLPLCGLSRGTPMKRPQEKSGARRVAVEELHVLGGDGEHARVRVGDRRPCGR